MHQTPSGVMVQIQHQQALDEEWARLVDAVRGAASELLAIVVLATSG